MALGKSKRLRDQSSVPKLQITSMMDMFTIILIFLLMSFSDNPDTLDIDKDITLPESNARQNYKETIKLTLSGSALTLEGTTIAKIKNGKIIGLDPNDLKKSYLYKQLILQRVNLGKEKVTHETSDTQAKEEKKQILFLCDKNLSFKTINNVVKTAGMAGFPNFQFAVLGKDS